MCYKALVTSPFHLKPCGSLLIFPSGLCWTGTAEVDTDDTTYLPRTVYFKKEEMQLAFIFLKFF